MKAKTYAVTLCGKTFLVSAMTRQGAVRDLLENLRDTAVVDMATGEQLYRAGAVGDPIIGGAREEPANPAQTSLELEKESQA